MTRPSSIFSYVILIYFNNSGILKKFKDGPVMTVQSDRIPPLVGGILYDVRHTLLVFGLLSLLKEVVFYGPSNDF